MQMNKMELNGKTILVTGAAGFIGASLVTSLLQSFSGIHLIGIDNMNDYYDVKIKEFRLKQIEKAAQNASQSSWQIVKGSIADKELIRTVFAQYRPDIVINLAAQAGVRYSIINPDAYIESNVIGFYHILEVCRHSYDEGKKEKKIPQSKIRLLT